MEHGADLGARVRAAPINPADCGAARFPAACSARMIAAPVGNWCARCGDHPGRKEWVRRRGRSARPALDLRRSARFGNCVRVGVSCGGVWQTDDDGASWTCRADGMRAEYMPPEQAIQSRISRTPIASAQCQAGAGCPLGPASQRHLPLDRRQRQLERGHRRQAVRFRFRRCRRTRANRTRPGSYRRSRMNCAFRSAVELVVTRTRDGGETFDISEERPAAGARLRHRLPPRSRRR